MRELMLDDYERSRQLRPYHLRRPVRVHRRVDWPLATTFDDALADLQCVMDNVNQAIGNYQGGLMKNFAAGGLKTSRTEDGNLQVAVDVAQYKPEEVQVKLCDDHLVVEAKTENAENDSYHKSELKRWIKLPADVKQEGIKSCLGPDGKLLIHVPMNKPIADSTSRTIPIEIQKPAVEDAKKGAEKNQ